MIPDGNGVDAHLDDRVIIATGLGHVAKIEDIFLLDIQFFEQVSHTEFFVHARSDGVNRGGTTDFVVKFRGEFFTAGDDFFTFLAIGVPGVFFFGAGVLAESREGDLRKAVFDDFVAFL